MTDRLEVEKMDSLRYQKPCQECLQLVFAVALVGAAVHAVLFLVCLVAENPVALLALIDFQ